MKVNQLLVTAFVSVLLLSGFPATVSAFDYYSGQVKEITAKSVTLLRKGDIKRLELSEDVMCYRMGAIIPCKKVQKGSTVRVECGLKGCFRVIVDQERL